MSEPHLPSTAATGAAGGVAGDILIVDDTPENLRMLSALLGGAEFRVRSAASGELALAAARDEPPDVVLLDIDMPDMDGYEVCRRFKADPLLAAIPILFVSALAETEDKLAAFAAGGVDYVTKPFRIEELRARIATHLELRRLRLELEARNRELAASDERAREVERLRHDLIHMVAHDMRSPLMGVSGYLELLELDRDKLAPDHQDFVVRALEGARTLVRQIDAMLDADRLESNRLPLRLAEQDLVELLDRAAGTLGPLGASRVRWSESPEQPPTARCDAELIVRVAANLLANALAYSDESEPVLLGASVGEEGFVRLEIRDSGPGIPEELRPRIFEKYVTKGSPRGRTRSMGLGLAFCKLAIEAHGGRIGFDSRADRGTVFWFELSRLGPTRESAA